MATGRNGGAPGPASNAPATAALQIKTNHVTSGNATASHVPARAAGVRSVRRNATQRPVRMAMIMTGRMIDTAAV